MGSSPGSRSLLLSRRAWRLLALAAVLALHLVPTEARADWRKRRGKSRDGEPLQLATRPYGGTYLSLGLNLGFEGSPTPDGTTELLPRGDLYPVLGAEASLVKLNSRDLVWVGGYVDLTHTLPNQATRMSIGPEVGWGPIGLDVGLVGELSRGRLGGGFQLRGLLSVSYVTAYASFMSLYDARVRNFVEGAQVGLLLKLPFVMEITDDAWHP